MNLRVGRLTQRKKKLEQISCLSQQNKNLWLQKQERLGVRLGHNDHIEVRQDEAAFKSAWRKGPKGLMTRKGSLVGENVRTNPPGMNLARCFHEKDGDQGCE